MLMSLLFLSCVCIQGICTRLTLSNGEVPFSGKVPGKQRSYRHVRYKKESYDAGPRKPRILYGSWKVTSLRASKLYECSSTRLHQFVISDPPKTHLPPI